MKYRTTGLNEKLALVKYSKKYKNYLHRLREMNPMLALLVQKGPEIYDEESNIQSYMIFERERFIGAIKIDSSLSDASLDVEIHLDDRYYNYPLRIVSTIDSIVSALKQFFSDKESIEIRLHNPVDLSEHNHEYHKNIRSEFLTTYTCLNRNAGIRQKLINEIEETEKSLTDLGLSWIECVDFRALENIYDKELYEEIRKGTASRSDMFNRLEELTWYGIQSKKANRKITFNRDGLIYFEKFSENYDKGINYTFNYNISRNGFLLNSWRGPKRYNQDVLFIDSDSISTTIKTNQISALCVRDTNEKRINYVSPIVNNSSISVEIWINGENKIERCYIDFRTHKKCGRINGIYILRLVPSRIFNNFEIRFIGRDGSRGDDYSDIVKAASPELYDAVTRGNIDPVVISALAEVVVSVINEAPDKDILSLDTNIASLVGNVMPEYKKAVDFVKQIEDEIPLPYLHECLRNFIEEFAPKTDDIQKRVLQNPKVKQD